jgi:FdhD protein
VSVLKKYHCFLIKNGRAKEVEDWVAAEDTYELYLNDTHVDTMVVSPSDLEAHALGYVVTEGLAKPEEVADVEQKGRQVTVRTKGEKKLAPSKTLWRSSGYRGREGETIPVVTSDIKVSTDLIVKCVKQISEQAEGWQKSGGMHISLLFGPTGRLIKAVEDIGRHNTVDKIVGYALLNHVALNETILVCSGRQPEGMVLKVARANIPIVVTKTAVTNRGIEAAKRFGVTLIGFAREDRFTIYTHPARVEIDLSIKWR